MLAIALQKDGQHVQAGELYARILEVAPEHPDALHFSGLLAHQQGRADQAVDLIMRSLAVVADNADAHNNLGIVHQSSGRFDDAIAAYQRAIAIDPRHANAHSNLGAVLRAVDLPAEAEAAYRTAIDVDPHHMDAHTNLGILLNALNRPAEASECFCRALTLQPRNTEARRLLVLAHCMLGEADRAVEVLSEWLEDQPGDPVALHMLAAATGRDVPQRASNAFVEKTFDSFAASFEAKLESLSYRAPALVAEAVAEAGVRPEQRLDILDAGSGTGLCGPLLRPYASSLVGVDLSAGMLDHARRKGVYTALVRDEICGFLRAHPGAFDVIVSADTLVYFGDLDEFCQAAAHALRPRGLLVFTVEHAVHGESDYRLELHGRYSHRHGYVEDVLAEAGLRARSRRAVLRTEAGLPVAGLVVRAEPAQT